SFLCRVFIVGTKCLRFRAGALAVALVGFLFFLVVAGDRVRLRGANNEGTAFALGVGIDTGPLESVADAVVSGVGEESGNPGEQVHGACVLSWLWANRIFMRKRPDSLVQRLRQRPRQ